MSNSAPPTDGNWEGWIISIAVSVIITLFSSLVGLARMVKDMYAKAIEQLQLRLDKVETVVAETQSENAKLREENAGLRAELQFYKKADF